MGEWIAVGSKFIAGDSVRWYLTIWGSAQGRGAARGKAVKLAELRVTTDIVAEADDEGYVWMEVRECEVLSQGCADIPALPRVGRRLTRKLKTIVDGKPERKRWNPECTREAVIRDRGWEQNPVPSAKAWRDD